MGSGIEFRGGPEEDNVCLAMIYVLAYARI